MKKKLFFNSYVFWKKETRMTKVKSGWIARNSDIFLPEINPADQRDISKAQFS